MFTPNLFIILLSPKMLFIPSFHHFQSDGGFHSHGDPQKKSMVYFSCNIPSKNGWFEYIFHIFHEKSYEKPGWLVVWTPLKNMSASVGMMIIPNISGKIKNWWQPVTTNQLDDDWYVPPFVGPPQMTPDAARMSRLYSLYPSNCDPPEFAGGVQETCSLPWLGPMEIHGVGTPLISWEKWWENDGNMMGTSMVSGEEVQPNQPCENQLNYGQWWMPMLRKNT